MKYKFEYQEHNNLVCIELGVQQPNMTPCLQQTPHNFFPPRNHLPNFAGWHAPLTRKEGKKRAREYCGGRAVSRGLDRDLGERLPRPVPPIRPKAVQVFSPRPPPRGRKCCILEQQLCIEYKHVKRYETKAQLN